VDQFICLDCGVVAEQWWNATTVRVNGEALVRCRDCYLGRSRDRARSRKPLVREGKENRRQAVLPGSAAACPTCGWSFIVSPRQVFCSAHCSAVANSGRRSPPKSSPILVHPCRICGRLYVIHGMARADKACCSDECRKMARVDSNRRKNLKRRGAVAGGVKYTFRYVANRDGWRCHLCGKKVDPNLSRRDPMGGSIDHLLPISPKHGAGRDAPENVKLAHLQCNSVRSAGGVVQLMLIG